MRSDRSQITKVAAERSVEKRGEYLARISQYTAGQLVFVDESSVDRQTTYRGRAWSVAGTKAQRKAFFLRGRRYLTTLTTYHSLITCLDSLYFLPSLFRMVSFTARLSRALSILDYSISSLRDYWTSCNPILVRTQSSSWITVKFINTLTFKISLLKGNTDFSVSNPN